MNEKAIVFCCLLSLSVPCLHAEDFDENDQRPSLPDSQLNAHSDLQDLLGEIEKRYGETAALLKSLHRQIEQNRRSLNKIRRDMQRYQTEIEKEKKELINQVRAAYIMGQQEKLKLMLNQQDPAISSRIMVYYNYFNKERLAKLAAIEKAMDRFAQLETQKQAESALLAQNLEQKKTEQSVLNDVRKQRNELLLQVVNDFSSDGQRLSQLKENENKLRGLIASWHDSDGSTAVDRSEHESLAVITDDNQRLTENFSRVKGSFSTLKGKLPWPVKGRVAHSFASLQSEDIQNGVLIDANEGVEIHAVAKGKVAFAEWMRSYGFLMIIDHGEGYMTLYAFNQSLFKQKNDSVEAGEVIAAVGQSGGRSQPGLYFGIRKQGMPIDPLEWCRKYEPQIISR